MLNEGNRLRYQHYLMLSHISRLPYMEEVDQRNFLDSLSRAVEDKSDILEEESIKAGMKTLKEILNG